MLAPSEANRGVVDELRVECVPCERDQSEDERHLAEERRREREELA